MKTISGVITEARLLRRQCLSALSREVPTILDFHLQPISMDLLPPLPDRPKRKLGQARDGADDIEVGPYRIECKRQETLSIMKWCRQVEACTKPGEIPAVIFRQNGEQWRVVLRLEHFLPLLREHLAELPSQPPSPELP